jgi:hypothetical protein
MRDHEYKRHGTLTLMAGIDLLTGHVHALVKKRHRSREFIEFLEEPPARPQRADWPVGWRGDHRELLSQAEGCWIFDARDRMPRSSRLTAHPPTTIRRKCTGRNACPPA